MNLTDARSAFEEQEASCNGKSRLFVALCRAHMIPARMVGGIMPTKRKKDLACLDGGFDQGYLGPL